jgi:hypothetical protein
VPPRRPDGPNDHASAPPTSGDPASGGPASAAPSVAARALAFGAILLAGICGGLIGYAFMDLQCTGDCGVQKGLGALVGSVGAAIGVAVIAVLTLRAMGEWAAGGRRDDRPRQPRRS